ncbi:class I adenylate-forming enzyme family protein [Microbacterium sp. A94]|uniref:class I adenylate-forming enzyme family protein n=1 Tax=Microbacterium sp. A94 TaxID=3450717 RepID=UPI003F43B2B2
MHTPRHHNTVPALLFRGVEKFADRDAFVFDTGSDIIHETYQELFDRSLEFARALVGLGIRPGDHVGVAMHNSIDLIHALFGSTLAGAVAVPMNTRLAPRESAYVIQDSGVRVLLINDIAREHVDLVERFHEALPGLADAGMGVAGTTPEAPALLGAYLFGVSEATGFGTAESFLAHAASVPAETVLDAALETDPESTYMMLYTSGTTANPKGCRLPHRSIVATGYQVGRERFGLTPEDKLWNALPFFHVSSQAPMTGVLDAGATYISMVYFDPERALDLIRNEGATVLFPAYPALTQPLLNNADDVEAAFSKVRAVLTVGPAELLRKYAEQFPNGTKQISCYGSTELGGIAVMGRLDDSAEERSTAGFPLDGVEMQVRDLETGEPVGPGIGGELWFRGFNLFTNYHNDAEKTAEAFDDEGWLNSGDSGSVDERGYLTFLGRVKDMLKVGGENVACIEIEAYLMSHPAVAVAAAVGKPDNKYDEVPVAFVELRPGHDVDPQEIIDFAAKGLAKFKVPREVHIVTEWPMNAGTKIQKFKLKEQYLS